MIGAVSVVTALGALAIGATYLGTISLGTTAAGLMLDPTDANFGAMATSVLSRGLIKPALDNTAENAVDAYNTLFQAGELLEPVAFK